MFEHLKSLIFNTTTSSLIPNKLRWDRNETQENRITDFGPNGVICTKQSGSYQIMVSMAATRLILETWSPHQ